MPTDFVDPSLLLLPHTHTAKCWCRLLFMFVLQLELSSCTNLADVPNVKSETGKKTLSESTVSNTELGEFFLALTEFRGEHSASSFQPNFLCAKANSPSFWQNSPSLPQNSLSSLFRNSTLETVFHPFPIKPPSAGTWIICWKIQTQSQRERPTLRKTRCIHILREIALRVRQVTNVFGYCELQCQECGEVLVTNVMTIFPGENLQESFATEKSTTDLTLKNFKFHRRVLLGPLLHNICPNISTPQGLTGSWDKLDLNALCTTTSDQSYFWLFSHQATPKWGSTMTIVFPDPEVLQSGFGMIFFGLVNFKKLPVNFSENFSSDFFSTFWALFLQGFRPPPKTFTPRIVSIPLQLHIFEPIFFTPISAYGISTVYSTSSQSWSTFQHF